MDISATADIEGLASSAREKFDWTVDSTSTDTFVIEEEIISGGFDAQVGSQRRGAPLSIGGSVLLWQDTDNTAGIQMLSYPDWEELVQVTDFFTSLYLYALFKVSERTTQARSKHTLDSSISAGRVNVGIRLAVGDNTCLRVGGGVEIDEQRRTNNDLDIDGAPNCATANSGQLVEFDSSDSGVDNGDIAGLAGSMTSSTARNKVKA